jgi:hypothetical protein
MPASPPKLRRRFTRRLLRAATILSLLLCLSTVGLRVRSYWRGDDLDYVRGQGAERQLFTACSKCGYIDCTFYQPYTSGKDGFEFSTYRVVKNGVRAKWLSPFPPRDQRFWFLGFGYASQRGRFHSGVPWIERDICLPHWFLALLFAVLPAVRLRAFLRARRRYAGGLCPACGYDLRATPERCPECGTVPWATNSA